MCRLIRTWTNHRHWAHSTATAARTITEKWLSVVPSRSSYRQRKRTFPSGSKVVVIFGLGERIFTLRQSRNRSISE
jgi:hypothetical protein